MILLYVRLYVLIITLAVCKADLVRLKRCFVSLEVNAKIEESELSAAEEKKKS